MRDIYFLLVGQIVCRTRLLIGTRVHAYVQTDDAERQMLNMEHGNIKLFFCEMDVWIGNECGTVSKKKSTHRYGTRVYVCACSVPYLHSGIIGYAREHEHRYKLVPNLFSSMTGVVPIRRTRAHDMLCQVLLIVPGIVYRYDMSLRYARYVPESIGQSVVTAGALSGKRRRLSVKRKLTVPYDLRYYLPAIYCLL